MLAKVLVAVLAVTFSAHGSATNRSLIRVDAPILDVQPITAPAALVCDVKAPPRSAGLAARLRWDLRERCRATDANSTVTGYGVDNEWDGRRFSTQLRNKPLGKTLPLELQIN